MYYSMSRLVQLDVKWADQFKVSHQSFKSVHYNPYYQLIAVAEGTVKIETNGQRHTLTTGQTLLLKPWEQHTGWGHEDTQGVFFWTQFSCTPEIGSFLTPEGKKPDVNMLHAEKTELRTSVSNHEDLLIIPRLFLPSHRYRVLSLFEELIQCSKSPKGYYRFQETLLLGEMLRLIASDFLEQSHSDTSFPTSYLTYRKLASYLNNFYELDLGKDSLEHAMDRKYEYLCQIFKRYSGTTIVNYITQVRIQRAKHLLLYTDLTVGDIASNVGFKDPFYFSRTFKKFEGIPPQNYRTSYMQAPTENK